MGWGIGFGGILVAKMAAAVLSSGTAGDARAASFYPLAPPAGSSSAPAPASPGPASRCRVWRIERDPRHPEHPGHYVAVPAACAPGAPTVASSGAAPGNGANAAHGPVPPVLAPMRMPVRTLVTHRGDKVLLRLGTANAVAELSVIALEDGAAGEVVRFRSSLGSTVLRGRIEGAGVAELVVDRGAFSGSGW